MTKRIEIDSAAETWTIELLMAVTYHASAKQEGENKNKQSNAWANNLWK